MRKFSNIFITLLLLFFSFSLPAKNGVTLKEKILTGRIDKEKDEVAYSVKVSKQEIDVIRTISNNALLKHRKLQLLEKSTEFLKKQCFTFDYECRKIYNMSLAYLKSELIESEKEMDELLKLFEESHVRLKKLEEKLALLEKGIEMTTDEVFVKATIPELEKLFVCSSVSGWNSNRGIFIAPNQKTDVPVHGFVKDIIKLEKSDGSVLIIEAGDYSLNFSYIKTALVKKGEIVTSGKKLFTGSAGNPVFPDTVLVFIVKKGKFVNPNFMCR